MSDKVEYHITIDTANKTAVDWLSEATNLSRQRIKQCMQKGAVWLTQGKSTQRLRRAKKQLAINTELHFYYSPSVLDRSVSPAELIHDAKDYSIWNKPYGMLCQGSKWGDHCTIQRYAEQNLQPQRPALVVHRLDRAATGLVILAHGKRIAAKFSQLFQQRLIEKHYRVWVEGEIKETITIDTPLYDKAAISHAHPLEYNRNQQQTLLDVAIETGRKHQIRRHLSSVGHPVVGDRLYGSGKYHDKDLQLSAYSLSFACPTSGETKKFCIE